MRLRNSLSGPNAIFPVSALFAVEGQIILIDFFFFFSNKLISHCELITSSCTNWLVRYQSFLIKPGHLLSAHSGPSFILANDRSIFLFYLANFSFVSLVIVHLIAAGQRLAELKASDLRMNPRWDSCSFL